MRATPNAPRRAFTLIELLAVIAVIALLAGMILPALAHAKARALGINCLSNLRQIGAGLRLWSADHDGKYPWQVDQTAGGGRPNGTDNARANFQLFLARAELGTPKILACPSDKSRQAAVDFAAFGTNNLSYALGDDADEKMPRNILAADRSLSGFDVTGLNDNTACYTINRSTGGRRAVWDKTICHGANTGTLAFGDGSVQRATNLRLSQAIFAVRTNKTVDGTLRFYLP